MFPRLASTRARARRVLASRIGIAAAFVVTLAGATQAPEPPSTWEGLERADSRQLDALYRKPGASLQDYRRIMLDPVEVVFRKDWTSDPRRVTSSDRERIRRQLAKSAYEVFRDELEKKGGYQFVTESAPDVLRVSSGLTNLYITAPDTMSAGRNRTFAVSAGEMTLVAQLRDADSGEILALAVDRKRARESGTLRWITHGENASEARAALRSWAVLLREALDASRRS